MKKLLLALTVLVCLPASAAVRQFVKPIDHGFVKVPGNFLASVLDHQRPHNGRLTSNVATEGGDNAFIIAVVGSAAGANGTFFRSQTTFVNNDPVNTRRVLVFYFPAGNTGGCGGGIVKTLDLAPFSWYVYEDVVQDLIGISGQIGSLVVIGVDSNNNFDSSANIDGFSRIFTPIFFGGQQFGTASQSFAPVAFSVATGTQSAYGLHSGNGFRLNYGIFNYAVDIGGDRSFLVRVYGLDGTTASTTAVVHQCSLVLTGAPSGNFGSGDVILDITPSDGQGEWYGIGSSVDNVSGDQWSSPTRP